MEISESRSPNNLRSVDHLKPDARLHNRNRQVNPTLPRLSREARRQENRDLLAARMLIAAEMKRQADARSEAKTEAKLGRGKALPPTDGPLLDPIGGIKDTLNLMREFFTKGPQLKPSGG